MSQKAFAGLIMAGGQSSRMGRDKAGLEFGGQSLLELACAKIAALTPIWHVSCAKGRPRPGFPCLEDDVESFGPVAGIAKGLEDAAERGLAGVLVLACDLPLMKPELLAWLLERSLAGGRHPAATLWRHPESGLLEPQAAAYDIAALPHFRAALAEGRRRLSSVIPPAELLPLPCLPQMAPCLLNCNRPEDLERALAWLAAKPRRLS